MLALVLAKHHPQYGTVPLRSISTHHDTMRLNCVGQVNSLLLHAKLMSYIG